MKQYDNIKCKLLGNTPWEVVVCKLCLKNLLYKRILLFKRDGFWGIK